VSANVSHKLSNAFEGALAGGGDPATSPLYVFTPFLKLIVLGAAAGVAEATFGASIWLVVVTVVVVSIMYRMVMRWVTDGSGGSGLAEEEFGGWAAKTNAAITYIEYTLTFLVSMAAMVTFIADRMPALNQEIAFGLTWRTLTAVALSILTGWLVNRGPKTAARFFGPATLAVLALLWIMIGATLWEHLQAYLNGSGLLLGVGLLPKIDPKAFSQAATAPGAPSYLHFTLAGFTRILALMTGIEVFANLVAAYGGKPEQKAKKAFGSLMIIMGTTALTMLVVGPAIFALSDPANSEVSVFTQTMDKLLPGPLAYLGTLVGIAVLLSASAASAEGIQNLSLGLSVRNYVPPAFGQPNRFGVAALPVWVEVAICCFCFVVIGTHEETYLAIYAAGVFILLSMTGLAATQRLLRQAGQAHRERDVSHLAALISAAVATLLTSVATVIIFYERFLEGAWVFLLLIPIIYSAFTYIHARRSAASPALERLGEIAAASQGGFGPVFGTPPAMRELAPSPIQGRASTPATGSATLAGARAELIGTDAAEAWPDPPAPGGGWRAPSHRLGRVLVPLDASDLAETALPVAAALAGETGALFLVSAVLPLPGEAGRRLVEGRTRYLAEVAEKRSPQRSAKPLELHQGPPVPAILRAADSIDADLIAIASHGRSALPQFLLGSVSRHLLHLSDRPVILVRPPRKDQAPLLDRLLVTLDGSDFAERVLPYAIGLAREHGSELILLVVPEIPEAESFGALADLVAELRQQAEARAERYLRGLLDALAEDGVQARGLIGGSGAARTIVAQAEAQAAGMILMATHGRGGIDGLLLGSVASRVIRHASVPVFVLPIGERRAGPPEA
jgi:nucleotide-binding universal stress UspA family protein